VVTKGSYNYTRYYEKTRHHRKLPVMSCGLASVIMACYHDNMIRTQISVDEELYRRAKELARRKGISLAELCRRGLEELVARDPSDKPWMSYAGLLEGEEDASESVDSVVYGREAP
jgi:hypothetical protein